MLFRISTNSTKRLIDLQNFVFLLQYKKIDFILSGIGVCPLFILMGA